MNELTRWTVGSEQNVNVERTQQVHGNENPGLGVTWSGGRVIGDTVATKVSIGLKNKLRITPYKRQTVEASDSQRRIGAQKTVSKIKFYQSIYVFLPRTWVTFVWNVTTTKNKLHNL
jgi:hypothetical protein